MKILIAPIVLVAMLLFQTRDTTEIRDYASTLFLGEELDLETGSIRFKKVVSDSRCPGDVTCIWPGEAKVLIEVLKGGEVCGEEILVVQNNSELLQILSKWFPGKQFSLAASGLYPYPETAGKIKPSDYRLTLRVAQEGDSE